MQRFAELYRRLDETTRTSVKTEALATYLRSAPDADAAWAVYFLTGNRPKRLVKSANLRRWAAEESDIDEWLFDECYDVVGDLAETITLLLPDPTESEDLSLAEWIERRLLPLRDATEDEQGVRVKSAWRSLDRDARFVWNKLFTSGFRVGVSKKLVIRALSDASGVDRNVVAHRLMGNWTPSADFYRRLTAEDESDAASSRPFPFCLAHALDKSAETLGPPGDWQVEWKWDGIRAQVIRRKGQVFIWTRGEELVTDRYPEVRESAMMLPEGVVLDGELLAWNENGVMPFGELQRRIGRKTVGKKLLSEVPVHFLAFDVLEMEGSDIRETPLRERRKILEALVGDRRLPFIQPADVIAFKDWEELAELRQGSRERLVEGLMLKRLDAEYAVGRKTGVWWKWKVDPLSVDAVLIYAQRGHGKRASLYTDYTFAVWDEGVLVPFAKAYSGLTDEEIRRVDRFVRRYTIERFGPVRSVSPELVFEIAFEGIRSSTRHKSGVAVRFPRIHRWRTDKQPSDADTLESLRKLLPTGKSERKDDGAV